MDGGQSTHRSLSDANSWNIPRVPLLAAALPKHPHSGREGLRRILLALGVRRRPVPDRLGLAGPRKVPRETVKEGGRDLGSPAKKSHRIPDPAFPSAVRTSFFPRVSVLSSSFPSCRKWSVRHIETVPHVFLLTSQVKYAVIRVIIHLGWFSSKLPFVLQ